MVGEARMEGRIAFVFCACGGGTILVCPDCAVGRFTFTALPWRSTAAIYVDVST